MATRYEQTAQDYEPSSLGHKLRVLGGTALASIAIAGGAVMGWAYNDLKQGVDGSVFDIHHAETHALGESEGAAESIANPSNFSLQTQTHSVEFAA